MILPYRDLTDSIKKYKFITIEKEIEMFPGQIFHFSDIATMVREFDIPEYPEYAIIDDALSSNDIIIIQNRFKVSSIINADINNNLSLLGFQQKMEKKRTINLNMMSQNPVFLTAIHLRSMNISLINQLLLDFDITIIEIEFIIYIIKKHLAELNKTDDGNKYIPRLEQLIGSFSFYHNLLNRDGDKSREIIDTQSDLRELAPMRTLISKAKSIYPNREEQVFFNDIDEYLLAHQEKIKK
jgi:hypothetical protein